MPKSTISGCFYFKASHAQELMEDKAMQPIQVKVVKILQLTGQQFRDFSANLLRDIPLSPMPPAGGRSAAQAAGRSVECEVSPQ